MKTLIVLLAITCTFALSAVLQAANAGSVTPEGREAFLKAFRRTGLNSTPGDAMSLRILIQSASATNGVEVGTFTGYGAIQMGIAFERNGGRLTTIEIDPDTARKARENIEAMGLEPVVRVIEGDALKVLPELEGEIDFVFIDAHKPDYLKYFRALAPKLKAGALVVADNVVQSRAAMSDYLAFMQSSPQWESVVVRASEEKGDGMMLSVKRRK